MLQEVMIYTIIVIILQEIFYFYLTDLLDNYKKIEQRINYIHYNPVAAGFVYHERDWKNSSFSAYEEGNREIPNVKVNVLW